MANTKSITTTKQPTVPTSAKLTKQQGLRLAVGLLAAALVVWFAIAQVQRQIAIHQQQQRFDSLRPLLQSFETNARKSLGSSLTDMKEHDTCYYREQTDFTKGRLHCSIKIQGATNELPGTMSSGNGAWETSKRLDAILRTTVQQSGLVVWQGGDTGGPESNDNVDSDDFFYPFERQYPSIQSVRCDFQTTKPIGVFNSAVTVRPDQVFFSFACDQRASKTFFPLIGSQR
jgi:hypothetical protein